jgi:hypothetical protein
VVQVLIWVVMLATVEAESLMRPSKGIACKSQRSAWHLRRNISLVNAADCSQLVSVWRLRSDRTFGAKVMGAEKISDGAKLRAC